LKSTYASVWEKADLEIPVVQALYSRKNFDGYNFQTDYLSVIDPPAITQMVDRLELDSEQTIGYVVLHEAAHAINARIYAKYPGINIEQRLDELSAATGNRVQFKSETEVEEFLADAVAIQHSDTAVRFVASRIIRGGERLGTTLGLEDLKQTVLLYPHDASAQLIQLLMTEQQNLLHEDETARSLSWIREQGNARASNYSGLPYLPWIQQHWNPLIEELFAIEFSEKVQREYLSALNAILEIMTSIWKS